MTDNASFTHNLDSPPEPLKIWEPKKYNCPQHGEHTHHITSYITGHEGVWCQICAIEALDRIGVCRLTEVVQC